MLWSAATGAASSANSSCPWSLVCCRCEDSSQVPARTSTTPVKRNTSCITYPACSGALHVLYARYLISRWLEHRYLHKASRQLNSTHCSGCPSQGTCTLIPITRRRTCTALVHTCTAPRAAANRIDGLPRATSFPSLSGPAASGAGGASAVPSKATIPWAVSHFFPEREDAV